MFFFLITTPVPNNIVTISTAILLQSITNRENRNLPKVYRYIESVARGTSDIVCSWWTISGRWARATWCRRRSTPCVRGYSSTKCPSPGWRSRCPAWCPTRRISFKRTIYLNDSVVRVTWVQHILFIYIIKYSDMANQK